MRKKTSTRPRGRPSVYPSRIKPRLKAIENAVRGNATRAEIAKMLGVATSSLSLHATQFSELSEALERGAAEPVALAKAALFKKAMGYSHPAVKIVTVSEGNNAGSRIEEVPFTEHYPPDTPALIFYLSNMAPAEFKQKMDHTHGADSELVLAMREWIQGASKKTSANKLPAEVAEP